MALCATGCGEDAAPEGVHTTRGHDEVLLHPPEPVKTSLPQLRRLSMSMVHIIDSSIYRDRLDHRRALVAAAGRIAAELPAITVSHRGDELVLRIGTRVEAFTTADVDSPWRLARGLNRIARFAEGDLTEEQRTRLETAAIRGLLATMDPHAEFATGPPPAPSPARPRRTPLLRDRVGLVPVHWPGDPARIRQAARDLIDRGARSLVLDLRGVDGGHAFEAAEVVAIFADGGTVVFQQTADEQEPFAADSREPVIDAPLLVLVDGETAGAAEVIAAALQQRKRAQVAGTATAGRGTLQKIFELEDGSRLTLTIVEYQVPGHGSLDGTGVKPDLPLTGSMDDVTDQAMAAARRVR